MSTDDTQTDSPGLACRRVVRAVDRASLATLRQDPRGWPYASLVLVACDHGAAPIMLISDLADHTKNLAADDRVSLLYDGTAGLEDPLTGARVSLQGRSARTDDATHAARYLARHPSAESYAGFGDFAFYRVAVEAAHIVAGFGRIDWVDGPALTYDAAKAAALAEAEADIVGHMNDDHADAVALFAEVLLDRAPGAWRMTGIDPEGCDLRLGGETARLLFESDIVDALSARRELVRLTKLARASENLSC